MPSIIYTVVIFKSCSFVYKDKGVLLSCFEHFPKVPNYKTATLELN